MPSRAMPDRPFASALAGRGGAFVSEVDESDGSIALYQPKVAVLNNISLDHKSMDELRALFLSFVSRSSYAIFNLDDEETRLLAERAQGPERITFSLHDDRADLYGTDLREEPLAIALTLHAGGAALPVQLQVPGRHNAANALAALAAVRAAGVPLERATQALQGFTGLRRRFDVVGSRNGISVIDDFGHNPDKIAATLKTLHAFPGRLLVFFQPHGYGPLKVLKDELIACFTENLSRDDVLVMNDPAYFGGTVERIVTSADIVSQVRAAGRNAEHIPDRAAAGERLSALAQPGDRIIVMGARDDTLSVFAHDVLERL